MTRKSERAVDATEALILQRTQRESGAAGAVPDGAASTSTRDSGGRSESASLRVFAGSRVTPELPQLLADLGGSATAAELAVGSRAWQLLNEMGGSLLSDLARLAQVSLDEEPLDREGAELAYWQRLLTHYWKVRRNCWVSFL